MKDFLVDKMKTKEIELAKAKEGEKLAKQQSNADREVIAFLDGRVRDLEDNVTDQGKQNELLKNGPGQLLSCFFKCYFRLFIFIIYLFMLNIYLPTFFFFFLQITVSFYSKIDRKKGEKMQK